MAQRIDLDGTTFAYEDSGGDGPCVLFLHGLGGSANGWLAQLESCRARGWRGIALDQRGAGRSDSSGARASLKGAGRDALERWALDAVLLLDELEIRRAAVVGHSAGCMIAVRAAGLLLSRAWAVALCGGILEWPDVAAATFAERARLARTGRMDEIAEAVAATGLSERCRERDPRLLGLMREAIASNDGESYALWAEAVAEVRMEGLGQIDRPLLALCGSEDPVTPPAAAEQIAAAALRGEVAVLDGAAHWCMLEDPSGTDELLFGFLERHRPGI